MSCSSTFGAKSRVGDAARFGVLPRTKDPVIVFSQRAVQSGELPELHLPQVVLIFRCLNALFQNVSNLLYGFFHVLHGVSGYEGVQRLVLSWQHLSIFPADLPLLH